MMQLKSTNYLYILGILPLWCVAIVGGILLASGILWLQLLLGLVGAYLCYFIIKKFMFLPRPKAVYSDLKPLDLGLPARYHVALFTSEKMAEFDFLNRKIELLSPFTIEKGVPVQVVVNPRLLKKQGERFVQVSVMRELESYRNKSQVKNVLGIAIPMLLLVIFIECYYLFSLDFTVFMSAGLLTYFGPLAGVAAVLLILASWNKSVSYQDVKIDKALLQYFTKQEVIAQIKQSDAVYSDSAKEHQRPVYQHYTEERIERLGRN